MSELINAQREAEGLVVHMGLDPSQIGKDDLTTSLFQTALLSVLEFGADTVAPTSIDLEAKTEV